MHCFSSGYEAAKLWLDYGLFISFAGNVIYPQAEYVREAARRLPLDSILVETDAPYLAPQGFRGKINTPGLIIHTYEVIPRLRNVPVESLTESVLGNFEKLFRGSPPLIL